MVMGDMMHLMLLGFMHEVNGALLEQQAPLSGLIVLPAGIRKSYAVPAGKGKSYVPAGKGKSCGSGAPAAVTTGVTCYRCVQLLEGFLSCHCDEWPCCHWDERPCLL